MNTNHARLRSIGGFGPTCVSPSYFHSHLDLPEKGAEDYPPSVTRQTSMKAAEAFFPHADQVETRGQKAAEYEFKLESERSMRS